MRIMVGLALFIMSFSALAYPGALESSVEEQVLKTLIPFDSKAVVIVEIEEKRESEKLPMLPFGITTPKKGKRDNSLLKSMRISIFSSVRELPLSTQKLLSTLKERFEIIPEISLSHISEAPIEKSVISVNPLSPLQIFYVAAFLCFLLLFWFQSRSIQKSARVIGDSFSKGASGFYKQNERLFDELEDYQHGLANLVDKTDENWDKWSQESLIAILSDCYWCEQDEYASFIWKGLSISKRGEIIIKETLPAVYFQKIVKLEPKDLHKQDDPYYLSPLPIEHLDNNDLLNLVKEESYDVESFSSLRREHFPTGLQERLQMALKKVGKKADHNFLKKQPASPKRHLLAGDIFRFVDTLEEEEVLKTPGVSLDLMKSFPSLGWLLHCPDEKISLILDSFSARELASAWIAPQYVLLRLTESLSPKKNELLQATLLKVEPSRDSLVYNQIIQRTFEVLEELDIQSNNEEIS